MSEESAIRLKKIFAKNLNYYLQKGGNLFDALLYQIADRKAV